MLLYALVCLLVVSTPFVSGIGPPPKPAKVKVAADYFVSGKKIPGIPFTVADSYAGRMPILSFQDESRDLFFWSWAAETATGVDDLTIWLQGGTGCSSLLGMMQQNGPFLINNNHVVPNPWSWTKLSNVLWVDQPVNVGLSNGTATLQTNEQIAIDFYAFLTGYFSTFPALKGKKLWLTGDSTAGQYIMAIADEIMMRDASENAANGINYQGFGLDGPLLTGKKAREQLPAVEFAARYQHRLGLSDSTMQSLHAKAASIGIDYYIANNVHYPATGVVSFVAIPDAYDGYGDVSRAAAAANSCFDPLNIAHQCPTPTDPLGNPRGATVASSDNFINDRDGFKAYVHADPGTVWLACGKQIFAGADQSVSPFLSGQLQRVIEKSPAKRNFLAHGELGMLSLVDANALTLQNTTWNGMMGYQAAPTTPLKLNGKTMGTFQNERGLMFARVTYSGHEIGKDNPALAFKLQRYLLGQTNL